MTLEDVEAAEAFRRRLRHLEKKKKKAATAPAAGSESVNDIPDESDHEDTEDTEESREVVSSPSKTRTRAQRRGDKDLSTASSAQEVEDDEESFIFRPTAKRGTKRRIQSTSDEETTTTEPSESTSLPKTARVVHDMTTKVTVRMERLPGKFGVLCNNFPFVIFQLFEALLHRFDSFLFFLRNLPHFSITMHQLKHINDLLI